jgi:hypothetical protein
VIFFFGDETLLAQDLMSAGWQLPYVDSVLARDDPGGAPGQPSERDRLPLRNALLSLWMRRRAFVAARQSLRLPADRRQAEALAGLVDAARRAPAELAARHVLPLSVERQVRLLERHA